MDISDYQGIPLSYGAGVNSTALAILLIESGWRGEIVFADTGAEWPDTYCVMTYFENEYLAPRGFGIKRLGKESRLDARSRQVEGISEFCERYAMLPIPYIRWCTTIFKTEPCSTVSDTYLIGIAADEAHRQKGRICPLID